MATQNGTLRLVPGTPSSQPPSGVGALIDDYNAMGAKYDALNALANQLNNSVLLNAVNTYHDAVQTWAKEIDAEALAKIRDLQTQNTQLQTQMANMTAMQQHLQDALKAAGLTLVPTAGGGVTIQKSTPGTTAPAPGATTPAGGYTAGQTTAVGVVGLVLGWFGSEMYREYKGRRS